MQNNAANKPNLMSFAVYSATLAAAGLPIYIHAPKFFVDNYGVSIAALGGVLFFLRLVDVIQDPVFGWISARLGHQQKYAVFFAAFIMSAGMIGLFVLPPLTKPLVWFGIMLAMLFSGFSFLTISFYAQGVETAKRLPGQGHIRLASWRESGALAGVCLASIAPTLFALWTDQPFWAFSFIFVVFTGLAVTLMRSEWNRVPNMATYSLIPLVKDKTLRRLLVIAFVNSAPVAMTSTLFLFFVEYRLDAAGLEGPLLLLFFLSAAFSVPLWARVTKFTSVKNALLSGMVLSIFTFSYVLTLGAGDAFAFAVVCIASGAALGADMTLLPAIFSKRLAVSGVEPSTAFGAWSFVSKLTLAFSALVVFPILDSSGLVSGVTQTPEVLTTLTLLYGGLPILLKLVALTLLVTVQLPRFDTDD